MSFGGRTPESLLPRSDSKNPSTTCKGITTNGRPCRRGLAQSRRNSLTPSPDRGNGVLAVLDGHSRDGVNAAAFYCWQHKDQAEQILDEKRTTIVDLTDDTKETRSVDSIVHRLGILDLDGDVRRDKQKNSRNRKKNIPQVKQRDTMPVGWQDMQSPLMTVPEEGVRRDHTKKRQQYHGRSNVKASFLCCVRAVEEDYMPPARRRGDRYKHSTVPAVQPTQSQSQPMRTSQTAASMMPHYQIPSPTASNNNPNDQARRTYHGLANTPCRPPLHTPAHTQSQTQTLLSLIPPHLPPTTTSTLLTELSKPISPHSEPGYIYIFWLTPDSAPTRPDSYAASSLLDEESDRPTNSRKKSDLLHQYAFPSQTPTILLKIGRASNVHRRLTQWTQQCGHNITLIRFYPSSHAKTASPRQVSHVARVERLIHLELAGQRVRQERCVACGREHREWFEVEASSRAVREVDGVVRRWVAWAERTGGDG